MNGGVASFVLRNTGSLLRYQECIFGVCSKTDNGCEMIQRCYITIPLRQGEFEWSGLLMKDKFFEQLIMLCVLCTDQSHLAKTCSQSIWKWQETFDGGRLVIKYKTKKKAGR